MSTVHAGKGRARKLPRTYGLFINMITLMLCVNTESNVFASLTAKARMAITAVQLRLGWPFPESPKQ